MGTASSSFGLLNTASSYGETVVGIGAATYTPSANGATQFRIANATDRVFTVGNAIDSNNNGTVDAGERSSALVVLKNGNTGIGNATPQEKLHVTGKIRMADGTQAAGRILVSDVNGTASWQNVSAASGWGLVGNAGTDAAVNFIGTTNNVDLAFRRNSVKAGLIGSANTSFGLMGLGSVTTGTSNTAMGADALRNNTAGDENTAVGFNALRITQGNGNTAIGAQSGVASTISSNATAIGYRAYAGRSDVVILGGVTGENGATVTSDVGIGTTNPRSRLEVISTSIITAPLTEGTININSNSPQAINAGSSITLSAAITATGAASRVMATVEGRKSNATDGEQSGYLMFKTNNNGTLSERIRVTSLGDVGIGTATPGGLLELSLNEGRKPGTNTWTIPSDERLKTIHGAYTKGLTEITKLNPITYNYKNTGEKTFEPDVLNTEFSGFSAQQVQQVFPEAVGTDDDGYLNLNIHPILIASVNAFKELKKENEELKASNEKLTNTVEDLLKRVLALEAKNN